MSKLIFQDDDFTVESEEEKEEEEKEEEESGSEKESASDSSSEEEQDMGIISEDEDNQRIDDENEEEEGDRTDYTEIEIEGEDTGLVYEGKGRKKVKKCKVVKRKIFPFIHKKKYKNIASNRTEFAYLTMDLRESTREYLSTLNLNIEKQIYNATVRWCKKDNLEDLTVESADFSNRYIEILRYITGINGILSKDEIIEELKQDIYGWQSQVFIDSIKIENKEIEKIKNPAEYTDHPDNPCPKCKECKSYRKLKQLRGGDEGQSALFWCVCGHHWRVNG